MNKLKNKFTKFGGLFKSKLNLKEFKVFQNAYYWFIAPLVVVLIGLICGTIYSTSGNKYDGFANVGVDFKGGTVLTVEVESGFEMLGTNYDANEELIRETVSKLGASPTQGQTQGTNAINVRYPNSINGENYNTDEKSAEMISINNEIEKAIKLAFTEKYGEDAVVVASTELINATASASLITKAILSVLLAILAILIYIIIRFDLFSGIAAILALIHDVLIVFAGVIIFRISINSSFIAAIITVVAYSINNTIIIFDRVRDFTKPYKNKKFKIDVTSAVNNSVKDTLTRSVLTTITTLITITALASVGIQALSEFALPIIFGLIAGAYSSVLIAPSIWGLMMKAQQKYAKKNKGDKTPAHFFKKKNA
ncbi:MAG: protein translocase subunit SecF [Christensenellaceae bacterium]|jgi:preprotein translocase subunit SecF|nr:protein translocase subunit SecF [Christensenellaceae bacterium]